ncbi:MAG: hypothetical protein K8U57_37815 [Planctomycetes bacterium]|nr:hypothetical protein [Planctomycetota bacterium]
MNAEPPKVTLWHRSHAKGSRWRRVGAAPGYAAAISLGEREGLVGGKWWLDTSPRGSSPACDTGGDEDLVSNRAGDNRSQGRSDDRGDDGGEHGIRSSGVKVMPGDARQAKTCAPPVLEGTT